MKIGILMGSAGHNPARLVKWAPLYEKIGFDDLWDCDHLSPFHTKGGNASYPVQLEAYLSVTKKVPIGSMVTGLLGTRQKIGDIAMHFMSMARLHPGRVICGVGCGEKMNYEVTGATFPPPRERVERLEEGVRLLRKIFTSDTPVTYAGKYHRVNKLFFYYKPDEHIPIIVASAGPKTASIAGRFADGFVTFLPTDIAKNTIFPSFEGAAKENNKDPDKMEKIAFIELGYHPEDYDKAIEKLRPAACLLIPEVYQNVYDPVRLESISYMISDKVISNAFTVATSPEEVIKSFEERIKVGFNHIIIDDWTGMGDFPKDAEKIVSYFHELYSE